MIKKEAENRILDEICQHILSPILENLEFKYLKSKSLFIRNGKELDIILQVYNLSQPFSIDENDNLNFNFSIRSNLQLTKFDKWHKKHFNKSSFNLVNAKFKIYNFVSIISFDDFTQNDFFVPNAARDYKINLINSLRPNINSSESQSINLLYKIISIDVIPEYSELDDMKSLIEFDRFPKIVKAELHQYSGNHEKAQNLFSELYNEINHKLEQEKEDYKISSYSRQLSEVELEYKILYNKQINPGNSKTKVEISKTEISKLYVYNSIFDRIGVFNKIIPPLNYHTNLAQDNKRGIDFREDTILIHHQQSILSEWNLNMTLVKESEYKHVNRKFEDELANLIPNDAYESAICESQDGSFIFAGGYNTKSYLINKKTKSTKVLWAHETFKEGYKENYKVSHNFGVNQAKYILNDNYILACACHAKNVLWNTSTLERKELSLPYEFTFFGAPPSTEFANDVKQICVFNKLRLFGLVIRDKALILNETFEITDIIDDVKQIRMDNSNTIMALIRSNNEIEIYKRDTTGNKR